MVNSDRLIQTFTDLVKLNSPTFEEKPVAEYLVEVLMQLGVEVFTDDSYLVTGSNSGNIIARLEGKTVARPLMINAHMDTIEPTEGIKLDFKEDIIKTDGKTILGADCKAGIAAIIEALFILKEQDILHGPVEIVFTVAEEKGLFGAKNLDYSKIKAKDCFVFDSSGQVGSIVYAAPTQKNLDIKFIGKAAHAGVEPEKGNNAIIAASKAVSNMKLGRIDEETTANVGIISGGKATNIIPPECLIKAEARSLNEKKLQTVINSMTDTVKRVAKETGTKSEIKIKPLYKGFNLSEEEPVIRIAELALKEMDIDYGLTFSVGGSDANIFNEKGIKSVSLSNGCEKCHSNEEYINIKDMENSAILAVKVIELYAGESVECLI